MEAEIAKLNRFQEFLRQEDRAVFEDMMNQCKLYASYASCMASPVRAIPLNRIVRSNVFFCVCAHQ